MSERIVLDSDDVRRTLVRIAHEVIEKNPESDSDAGGSSDAAAGLAIVGIHTRGAVLARRLH